MNKFIRIIKYAIPLILLVAVLVILICEYKKPDNKKFAGMAAIVCRVGETESLFADNADMRVAPASLTKLLTASVALENMRADEVFTVGSEQQMLSPNSSVSLISAGHQLTLRDLIRGMLMMSGNDAAYTVAVSVARAVNVNGELPDKDAVECFCGLMNESAKQLGMNNSRFTTPDGSDSNGQYSTANDLRILAEHALSVPEIQKIVTEYQRYVVFESGENITWTNTNRLLNPDDEFYRKDAIGMKTGTTSKAGCCLIAAFVKDSNTYISVVMGCGTDEERYSSTLFLVSEYAGL